MAQLERLRVYPVKGLDGVDVETSQVLDGGTLEHDRAFALFDADGDVFNGKRTDSVHDLATDFDPESGAFVVETPSGTTERFALPSDRRRAEAWFSDFFETDLTLKHRGDRGFVDRPEMGPSVVSTATLEAVASWFAEMTVQSARRRLRANVEVGGVEAFWEDRFVGDDAPEFEVGDVRFEGVTPCGRCVVPSRDPETGDALEGFRERFIRKRRETFPDFADADAFDHHYTVMLIARVPAASRGRDLRVGDPVTVLAEE